MLRNILLIGNKGLIGNYLYKYFKKKRNIKIISIDKKDNIDLIDHNSLKKFLLKNKKINYIINASGKNDHIAKNENKNSFENNDILIEYIKENVIGPKNLIELAISTCPNLKSIIHFSSLYGTKSPFHPIYKRKKSLSYCVSKHALEGLTKYYATLYARKKIRINNIRVGGVRNNQPRKFVKDFLYQTPAGLMVNKLDLAHLVDFISSEKSQYIFGENISLDGGYTLL